MMSSVRWRLGKGLKWGKNNAVVKQSVLPDNMKPASNSRYASVYHLVDQCTMCLCEIVEDSASSSTAGTPAKEQRENEEASGDDDDVIVLTGNIEVASPNPSRKRPRISSGGRNRRSASIIQSQRIVLPGSEGQVPEHDPSPSIVVDRAAAALSLAAALVDTDVGDSDGHMTGVAARSLNPEGDREEASVEPIVLLPCGHLIGHYDCAVRWFYNQREENVKRGIASDSDDGNAIVTTSCPTCRSTAKLESLSVINGIASRLRGGNNRLAVGEALPTSSAVYLEKLEHQNTELVTKVKTIDERVVNLYDSVQGLEERLSDIMHRDTLIEIAAILGLDGIGGRRIRHPRTNDISAVKHGSMMHNKMNKKKGPGGEEVYEADDEDGNSDDETILRTELSEEELKRRGAEVVRLLVNSGAVGGQAPSAKDVQQFVARLIVHMQSEMLGTSSRIATAVSASKTGSVGLLQEGSSRFGSSHSRSKGRRNKTSTLNLTERIARRNTEIDECKLGIERLQRKMEALKEKRREGRKGKPLVDMQPE